MKVCDAFASEIPIPKLFCGKSCEVSAITWELVCQKPRADYLMRLSYSRVSFGLAMAITF